MYELTYKNIDGCIMGLDPTNTVIESLEIMVHKIQNEQIGGAIQEIIIKCVAQPSICWDNWGREIR